jgi:hypothetical protein
MALLFWFGYLVLLVVHQPTNVCFKFVMLLRYVVLVILVKVIPLYIMLEKFKIRSRERIGAIVSEMKALYASESFDELEYTEKAVGIKYDPLGVLFDDSVAGMIDLSSAMHCDVAHCLFASGGIAQYHLNMLVLRIVHTTSTTLDDIDRFQQRVKPFKGKLTKSFFKDRIVDGVGKHMRCFASECMTAVMVMAFFINLVLGPSGKLVEECVCFRLLEKLVFRICKRTSDYATLALEAAMQHQELFIKLYPDCAKPKLHYLLHAIRSWIISGEFLDCMGAEAEHKMPKRVMAFAYKSCTFTAMAYLLHDFFEAVQKVETFMSTHLSGGVVDCDYKLVLSGQEVCIRGMSRDIMTPIGHFSSRDNVRFGTCIGTVDFFLSVTFGTLPTIKYFVVVEQHHQVPGMPGVWRKGEKGVQSIFCTDVLSCGVAILQCKDDCHFVPHVGDMHDHL